MAGIPYTQKVSTTSRAPSGGVKYGPTPQARAKDSQKLRPAVPFKMKPKSPESLRREAVAKLNRESGRGNDLPGGGGLTGTDKVVALRAIRSEIHAYGSEYPLPAPASRKTLFALERKIESGEPLTSNERGLFRDTMSAYSESAEYSSQAARFKKLAGADLGGSEPLRGKRSSPAAG